MIVIKKIFYTLFVITSLLFLIKKDNDVQILHVILKDSNYQKNDSMFLSNYSDKTLGIQFFHNRNIVNRTARFANKNKNVKRTKQEIDSLWFKHDTIIYTVVPVKKNEYIRRGKGINKKVELFLKDSFNLKKKSITWNIKEPLYNVFLEKNFKNKNQLVISKPIYNFERNKAIVIKKRIFSGNIYDETIYFIENTTDNWKIIFQQSKRNRFVGRRLEDKYD